MDMYGQPPNGDNGLSLVRTRGNSFEEDGIDPLNSSYSKRLEGAGKLSVVFDEHTTTSLSR